MKHFVCEDLFSLNFTVWMDTKSKVRGNGRCEGIKDWPSVEKLGVVLVSSIAVERYVKHSWIAARAPHGELYLGSSCQVRRCENRRR
jgi:hypothetical protein